MKVTLAKFGGLAAGIRRPPKTVDLSALPAAVAGQAARLIDAARTVPQPSEADEPGPARDAMGYKITIEDGGQPTVLQASDGAMSPAFSALMRWLDAHKPA